MEFLFEALLAIPGVKQAMAALAGQLAPPFLIALLVLWASGKFFKEDVFGKKFVLDVEQAIAKKEPRLDIELLPLFLLLEAITIGIIYCSAFGFGDTLAQRIAFAAFGGAGSGLAAYCVSAGLYDVAHGVAKSREKKKEAQT